MVDVVVRAMCEACARAGAQRGMHAWRSSAAARPRARTSDVRGGDGRVDGRSAANVRARGVGGSQEADQLPVLPHAMSTAHR